MDRPPPPTDAPRVNRAAELEMDERPQRPVPARHARGARRGDLDADPSGSAPLPPVVRVATRDPVPVILAGALIAFLIVAIVKPWPDEPRSVGQIPPPAAPPAATASPTADPLADLRRQCEEPLGWRVFTIE